MSIAIQQQTTAQTQTDYISMALSFCSSWDSLEHHFNQDMSSFQPELLSFPDTCVDHPILQPQEFFYADNYTNQLPYLPTPSDYLLSLSQEIFPLYPEAQMSFGNQYFSNFTPGFFDGSYAPNPGLVPEPVLEVVAPLPEMAFPCGSPPDDQSILKKPPNNYKESLSAQSIAARERRRKIAEKTQELGKRVPGGNKMNTAEMFQAAFKYVKYLQAQITILESMGSIQETKELQDLLASPIIQEKLYSREKCLVPKEFLQTLPNSHEFQ